jgi:hypothetical protein
MKLLPEKWKPSESNQCGFGRKSAVFQAHHWNVWKEERRGLKQTIEKALIQSKLNSKFVLQQTPSGNLRIVLRFVSELLLAALLDEIKTREDLKIS